MSSAAEGNGVSTLWAFRGTEYLVSSSARDNILEVEVEETLSMEQWKGRFEAKRKIISLSYLPSIGCSILSSN